MGYNYRTCFILSSNIYRGFHKYLDNLKIKHLTILICHKFLSFKIEYDIPLPYPKPFAASSLRLIQVLIEVSTTMQLSIKNALFNRIQLYIQFHRLKNQPKY